MLVVEDGHDAAGLPEDADHLVEQLAPGIELLPLFVQRIGPVLPDDDHAIDRQRVPSAAERGRDGRIERNVVLLRGGDTDVVGGDLLEVDGDDVAARRLEVIVELLAFEELGAVADAWLVAPYCVRMTASFGRSGGRWRTLPRLGRAAAANATPAPAFRSSRRDGEIGLSGVSDWGSFVTDISVFPFSALALSAALWRDHRQSEVRTIELRKRVISMNRRAHIRVLGQVQGVAFRASARREAKQRGLRGWAANNPDGSVEMVVEGDAADVQALIAWAQHGPIHAHVDDVEVRLEEPTGEFQGFDVHG